MVQAQAENHEIDKLVNALNEQIEKALTEDGKKVKVSLDGREGTFEISYALSRKLGIVWKDKVVEVDKEMLMRVLKGAAHNYLSDPELKDTYKTFANYVKGDVSLAGGKGLLQPGITWSSITGLAASTGLTFTHNEKQNVIRGSFLGSVGSESSLNAKLFFNNVGTTTGISSQGFFGFLSLNVANFPLNLGVKAGRFAFSTPLSNPVMGLVGLAVEKGFAATAQAKNIVDGAVKFVGTATGIAPAWEAAQRQYEITHNVLEAVAAFVKEFIRFWAELVKELVTSFVEALDYLLSLIREPPKVEVDTDEKAAAIAEKMALSLRKNNPEELEDLVKATKGQGPAWFKGVNRYWEDVTLLENYGLFKSPLAPWKWLTNNADKVKQREEESIQFLRKVISFYEKERDNVSSAEEMYKKMEEAFKDDPYVKSFGGFGDALVGTLTYLQYKIGDPRHLYTDRDVLLQLLLEKKDGITSVQDIAGVVLLAARDDYHNFAYVGGVIQHNVLPADQLDGADLFLLNGHVPKKGFTPEEEKKLVDYFKAHTDPRSVNYLTHLFEENPSLGWKIWSQVKEAKDAGTGLFELSKLLGMDHLWNYGDMQIESWIKEAYKAYKLYKEAQDPEKKKRAVERFITAASQVPIEALSLGYFLAENEQEVQEWNKLTRLINALYVKEDGALKYDETFAIQNLSNLKTAWQAMGENDEVMIAFLEDVKGKLSENPPEKPQTAS